MRLAEVQSFISFLPTKDNIDLGSQSIIVDDNGTPYLVGTDAGLEQCGSERAFGGSLRNPQYRVLLKAIVAKTLGEGDFSLDIAMSAAFGEVDKFRNDSRATTLKPEDQALLENALAEIKFKQFKSDGPWKICRVSVSAPATILAECRAVSAALPEGLKSYVLWQLGHGDFQQVVVVDSRVQANAVHKAVGLGGAIRRFADLAGISLADASKSWRTGTRIIPGDYNGKQIDCEAEKRRAINEHFFTTIGTALNLAKPYAGRAKNIVLSGGGAKDEATVSVLRELAEADGNHKLHLVNQVPHADKFCEDPTFTVVHGLSKWASLALDVGNGSLKGGYRHG